MKDQKINNKLNQILKIYWYNITCANEKFRQLFKQLQDECKYGQISAGKVIADLYELFASFATVC